MHDTVPIRRNPFRIAEEPGRKDSRYQHNSTDNVETGENKDQPDGQQAQRDLRPFGGERQPAPRRTNGRPRRLIR